MLPPGILANPRGRVPSTSAINRTLSVCHNPLPEPKLLLDSKFFRLLQGIDLEHAARVRANGCSCGGRLHSATYPRKPKGGCPEFLRAEHRRLSFCCGRDGCRQRHTPRSVVYLGRRVYLAAVFVLGSALRDATAGYSAQMLCATLGITRDSLDRWRGWWQNDFPSTSFWQIARAQFVPPLEGSVPAGLLLRFSGDAHSGVLGRTLSFLSPLSTVSEGR